MNQQDRDSRELTYDRFTEWLKDQKRDRERCNKPFPSSIEEVVQGRIKLLNFLEKESKVFWIDELTLESLLNEPFQLTNLQDSELRLPFSAMFFDLENGLDYHFLGEEIDPVKIGGLLFSEAPNDCIIHRKNIGGIVIRSFRLDGELDI